MNILSKVLLQEANRDAIYNLYLYLIDKNPPNTNETLKSVVLGLETALNEQNSHEWDKRDIYRLKLIKNAVISDELLAKSKINNMTISANGLTACTFTNPNGDVSVAFKGTGSGEWIDNGEGLSGIPEENTYIFYDNAKVPHLKTIKNDYASDQQAEALNWFRYIVAKNDWGDDTKITISGHSKGGNKAQFITINSDLVDKCFSFNGHGFSPEALTYLKKQQGEKYEKRRQRIFSFVTSNDYVNVLGTSLVPKNQIYYFKSNSGIHQIDSMLNQNGKFLPQSRQGALSAYTEKISKELMDMPPSVRQYATLGIMNIFQNYLGKGPTVNGDFVSTEKTIAGIIIAIGSFLNNLGEIN